MNTTAIIITVILLLFSMIIVGYYDIRKRIKKQNYPDNKNTKNSQSVSEIEELDPNDRYYTFVIKNNDKEKTQRVRLFGASKDFDDTFNQANNVEVKLLESSHREAKFDSIFGYQIKGIIMVVETKQQLKQDFTIIEKSSFGREYSWVWTPRHYKDPLNFDDKVINTDKFETLITGNKRIEFDILKGETMRIIFKITDKINIQNAFHNKNIIESSKKSLAEKSVKSEDSKINFEDIIKNMFTGKYDNKQILSTLAYLERHPKKQKDLFLKYHPDFWDNKENIPKSFTIAQKLNLF